jgi:5-enolpyruvylshikimate-3-phosphate synthase
MKIASAVVASMLMCFCAYTQDYPLTDSLKRNLEQAKTAEQKIKWLGELSSFIHESQYTRWQTSMEISKWKLRNSAATVV